MARLLSEIEAAAYVIDPLPNLTPEQVQERLAPFVQTLRQARPATPIVLVESITYQEGDPLPQRMDCCGGNNRALRKVFDQLHRAGVNDLHYLPGADLLGDDGEATVDGTHPTDLGFYRMAHAMRPLLGSLLDRPIP